MEAELVALKRGPAGAIESIESTQLDLTDPANRVALRMLVTSQGEQGEHAQAKDRVRNALAAHPDESAFHALQAQVLLAAGDGAESVGAAFERALELDPANAPALVGMAQLAAQRGDLAAALAFYDRALAAQDLPETALAAARLQRDSAPEAAIARLVTLLEQHPRESGASLELARLLLEQGELERALDFARRAAWFHEPGADQLLAELRERQQG
jgi:tetratricopeptide (TPR) repeat protein